LAEADYKKLQARCKTESNAIERTETLFREEQEAGKMVEKDRVDTLEQKKKDLEEPEETLKNAKTRLHSAEDEVSENTLPHVAQQFGYFVSPCGMGFCVTIVCI
jgi:hypothetical protein